MSDENFLLMLIEEMTEKQKDYALLAEEKESTLKKFQGELKRCSNLQSELESMNLALKKEISSMESKQNEEQENDSVTKNKLKAVTDSNIIITTKLFQMLESNAPKVPQEANIKGKIINYQPISFILQALLQRALDFPKDPFIEISENMHQSHIEYLVTSQIAVMHPHVMNRIALVDPMDLQSAMKTSKEEREKAS
ncbi:Centromere protein K [Monocercomonoides exilis]|uniref:Centromere protein K n=1 Tax=Monocercomonoides exilis TaxID=2049356 RepID=UPI0035596B66|nr:Centromere protein K [Monocercomonoides exilis]